MYDIKVYSDREEKETLRNLSITQAAAVQIMLDRLCIKHTVKRLQPDHSGLTAQQSVEQDTAQATCICTADLTNWPVLPNPDCPVHGSLSRLHRIMKEG